VTRTVSRRLWKHAEAPDLVRPSSDEFKTVARLVDGQVAMTVDVLYGDLEGGQRVISRFSMLPRQDGGWLAGVSRHWSIDGVDPRR